MPWNIESAITKSENTLHTSPGCVVFSVPSFGSKKITSNKQIIDQRKEGIR